jgi:hypothetical protein
LGSFPFLKEYVKTYWPIQWRGADFDKQGNRHGWGSSPRTYGAYAAENLIAEDSKRWAGLEEDLPDLSTSDEVKRAIPSKTSKVNKWYRLVKHSKALE